MPSITAESIVSQLIQGPLTPVCERAETFAPVQIGLAKRVSGSFCLRPSLC